MMLMKWLRNTEAKWKKMYEIANCHSEQCEKMIFEKNSEIAILKAENMELKDKMKLIVNVATGSIEILQESTGDL
jgi:hypothetical protein